MPIINELKKKRWIRQTSIAIPTSWLDSVCVFQAAATLKDLYKKHPVLYNTSIVCSFEPKVIYRVQYFHRHHVICGK